jgi:arylsulfatase
VGEEGDVWMAFRGIRLYALRRCRKGQHTLSVHFSPIEKHLKPDYSIGNVTLSVDGKQVGEMKGVKVAGQYSAVTGYGLLIGRNTGTPVSHEYKAPYAFTGKLDKVTVDLK